ncbi:MAG: aldo/keto reductase [Candidatus Dormibacteria bacterium]
MPNEYRRLGNSDIEVSAVGLGTNNFGRRLDENATARVVDAALDAGITFFDTANVYGGGGDSERFLGAALKGRRSSAVIATKFGAPMPGEEKGVARGTRTYIRNAVEQSLERLGTDYIDLYQIHSPDTTTPITETLGALNELVDEGKVRYFGSSNFDDSQLRQAHEAAQSSGTRPFVSVQNHYSWLHREAERDVLPTCLELGVGFIPYFPLANGVLTGKYTRDEQPPEGTRLAGRADNSDILNSATWDVVEQLEAFGREAGASLLEIAIGGLAAMPGVSSVIAGATSAEQVRSNVQAGSWKPDSAQLDALRRIGRPDGGAGPATGR